MAERCQDHPALRLAAPARAGGRHAARDPRGGPAAVRAAGLRGDDDGRDRGRGAASRSRPSTSRSRPRAACCARSGTCSCAATRTTSPVAERDWYREVLEEPDPERQLRLNARNARRRQAARRRADRGDPQRGARRPRHRRRSGSGSSPTSTTTSARSSSAARAQGARAAASTSTRADGHPLDAQPPGPLAAAGRSSAAGRPSSRAVVRRHGLRAAAALRRTSARQRARNVRVELPHVVVFTLFAEVIAFASHQAPNRNAAAPT